MSREVDNLIEKSVGLAIELCDVAEQGQAVSDERGCSVFFGVVRDCAYAIMLRAEREKKIRGNFCVKDGLKEGLRDE